MQGAGASPNNKLLQVVDTGNLNDNSVAFINQKKAQQLQFFKGDAVFIKNYATGKQTVAIILVDPKLDQCQISINNTIRKNIDIQLQGFIQIRNAVQIPYLVRLKFKPVVQTLNSAKGLNLAEKFVIPYFKDAYRPAKLGDKFKISRQNQGDIWFQITGAQNNETGIVGPQTLIYEQSFATQEQKI